MPQEGGDTISTHSRLAGVSPRQHPEALGNSLIRKEQSMQIGFLVHHRRRVSLMAVFVALLALVIGSAAALAALTPVPPAF